MDRDGDQVVIRIRATVAGFPPRAELRKSGAEIGDISRREACSCHFRNLCLFLRKSRSDGDAPPLGSLSQFGYSWQQKEMVAHPIVDIDPEQLRKLMRLRPTKEEIAAYFQCSKQSVDNVFKRREDLRLIYERGLEAGRTWLRRRQVALAQGTGMPAVSMVIHLSKHWLGESDKSLVEMTGKGGGPVTVLISKKDAKL